MAEGKDTNIQITTESTAPVPPASTTPIWQPFHRRHWWSILVAFNVFLLLAGQTSATLLSRFYFDKGGNSKWLATLVQIVGFPILLPLFLLAPIASTTSSSSSTTVTAASTSTSTSSPAASTSTTVLIYFGLGLLVAADDMLYTYGVAFLPVSTYSLICATQLAFNCVFSFFLNSQKFTPPILNSVILVIFSAVLLAVRSDTERPAGISDQEYAIGFACTLSASALYALILSLMQFSFQRHFKKETFSIVLEMQVYTSALATAACMVGLFASGEWKKLSDEFYSFKTGKISYVMTVVWTAVAWQVGSVGVVGLIFTVSSLFSNLISTVALPIVPVLAIFVFNDKMDAVKLMALLLSLWGFASYAYQQYLDSAQKPTSGFVIERKKKEINPVGTSNFAG
ncbi:probable purine permease 11 [Nymphaea colorata]|uniref:Probable purine permease n=1 Tax=Nymphaea colorata TaxID=210225 RepID=A0A5K1CRF5_9MAGN|nr:probable purine permease 11 [Nymphaea colorata]